MSAKLDQKIALQMQRLNYFEKLPNQLNVEKISILSLPAVSSHLDLLEKKWDQFDYLHNSLYDTKSDGILTTQYHQDNVHDKAQLFYANFRAALLERKEKLLEDKTPSGKDLLDINLTASGGAALSHTLPEIKLPVFSGDQMEWVPFRDLFLAIIGKDASLQPATKMYYLKTQLTGEARALIENLPPSNESFQPAWDLLVRRYDNPRLLIKRHAESILYGPRVTEGSAASLKELINTNTRALDSLKSLGSQVKFSDVLLITATLNKLDSNTVARWETKLGLSKDFPTYDKLLEFLELTAIVWEGSENARERSPSTSRPISIKPSRRPLSPKSLNKPAVSYTVITEPSGTTVENTDASNRCAVCDNNHYVLWCPKFKTMTIDEKVETVKNLNLCFNCLGRHRVRDCINKNRCKKCGHQHHTELHFEDRAKAVTQRRPSEASGSNQSASSEHSIADQK